jgi:hypothetical protein
MSSYSLRRTRNYLGIWEVRPPFFHEVNFKVLLQGGVCNGLLLANCKFPTITPFLLIASNLGDVPSTILGFFMIIYTMWRNCE